jgi:hypothetical protein
MFLKYPAPIPNYPLPSKRTILGTTLQTLARDHARPLGLRRGRLLFILGHSDDWWLQRAALKSGVTY